MMHLGANSTEAADATQEALVSLLLSIKSGREVTHPKAWVATVATRYFFRQKHQDAASFAEVPDIVDPLLIEEEVIASVDVHRALQALSERQADIMRLYLLGFRPNEIAELTGASEATVRSNLRHARRKMQAELLPRGRSAGQQHDGFAHSQPTTARAHGR